MIQNVPWKTVLHAQKLHEEVMPCLAGFSGQLFLALNVACLSSFYPILLIFILQ